LLIWFGQFVFHGVTKIAATVYENGDQIWRKCDSNEDPDCFNFVVPVAEFEVKIKWGKI
jgi:hypothetical protein